MRAKAIKKRYITLWMVLLLALLGWWMQRQEGQGPIQPQAQQAPMSDYSLADFVITAMDDQGVPKHRLRGQSMVHYADTDYAELVQPQLEVYAEQSEPPVTLDAQLARVYQGGESVLLEGDVLMLRPGTARQSAMQVQTRDLWLFTEREYAETGAEVTIRDGLGVTTAKGMTIDMQTGVVNLLASVRGEYVLD